jgi:hypothetical protein
MAHKEYSLLKDIGNMFMEELIAESKLAFFQWNWYFSPIKLVITWIQSIFNSWIIAAILHQHILRESSMQG